MVGTAPELFESPAGGFLRSGTPCDLSGDLSGELADCERLRAAHQDLLRAISHDLRAPLRHVTAFAPLLRELIDTPVLPAVERTEALEFLGMMEQAGQRMVLMLDGVLALSRVAAAPIRLEPLDLDVLVHQVVDRLASAAPDRHIKWCIEPLPTVLADAGLLRPALAALLGNAMKFTERTDQACVRVAASHDADGRCCLRVQDNGAGFDMACAQGLFGLFQRLHPEREFKGVGAGLALVRAVAERHGGTVSAQASAGSGCCIEMVWPA